MKIHNSLPLFLDCMRRWEAPPSARAFHAEFAVPMEASAGDFFDGFHSNLSDLNWELYRSEVLTLDPAREEARVREVLSRIEALFGFPLEGELVMMGAFTAMDGFARYDSEGHTVYLGMDESHGRGKYLDILIAHELTHVARETRPSTWEGWGLDPKMPRRVYLDSVTAIEHLMSEGFSCLASELVVPGEEPWAYCYQDADTLARILQHGPAVDRVIHRELRRGDDGNYGAYYRNSSYSPEMPDYTHYAWAWQWTKHLLRDLAGGDPRKLVGLCSKDLVEDALRFKLEGLLPSS